MKKIILAVLFGLLAALPFGAYGQFSDLWKFTGTLNPVVSSWFVESPRGFSGGILSAQNLISCNSIDSTATGKLICGTDEAGGAGGAATGSLLIYFDKRYVNTFGDTMTGALKVRSNFSGSTLNVDNLISCNSIDTDASGRLTCGIDETAASGLDVGTADVRYVNIAGDNMTGALAIKIGNPAVSPDVGLALEIIGSASGRIIHAQDTLTSSGGAVIEGTLSGSAIRNFGLSVDCDTPTTSKLMWDATNGIFSCGTDTDTDTNTTYTAAEGLQLTGTAFKRNATMTGTSLEIFGTSSGRILHAQDQLRSSGTLLTESGIFIAATALVVQADGQVGMGTASPAADLHIIDNDSRTEILLDNTAADGDPLVNFRLPGVNQWVMGLDDSDSDKFKIDDGSAVGASTRFTIDQNGLVGVGTASPKVLFETAGAMSGQTLTVSTLKTCNLDTDANGALTCGTDADTTYTVGQGLTLNGTVLSLTPSHSGSIVRAVTTLASSGNLVVEGAYSGSTMYVAGQIRGSGALKVTGQTTLSNLASCTNVQTSAQGLLSCNNTSYQTTSLAEDNVWVGNGTAVASALPSCSNGTSQALEYNTSTNAFSCATIAGTAYTAGQGLTLTSNNFSLNTTVTGSLVRAVTTLASSGNLVIEGSTSGASLYIAGPIRGSGGIKTTGTVIFPSLINCDTIDTNASGQLSCGTDASGGEAAGIVDYYVRTQGDTMTGGLLIVSGGAGTQTIDAGLLLEIAGTASGRVLHAQDKIEGSGSLVIEGAVTFATALTVPNGGTGFSSCTDGGFVFGDATNALSCASVLADDTVYIGDGTTEPTATTLPSCSAAGDTLNYNTGTNAWACGTDADTTYTAGEGLVLTGTVFSRNATLTGTSLEIFGTASGRIVHAQDSLRSSGTLLVEGASTLQSTLGVTGLVTLTDDLTVNGGNINFGASTTIGDGGDQLTIDSNGTLVINDGTINLSNQIVGVTLNNAANSLNFDSNTLSIDALNNRVGIGQTAPDVALDVNGTISGGLLTIMGGNSYILGNLSIGTSTAASTKLEVVGTLSGTSLFVNGSGATAMLMTQQTTGRTGLGTSTPKAKLDVVGAMSGTSLNLSGSPSCAFLVTSSAGALSCGTTLAVANGGTALTALPTKTVILTGGGGTPSTTSGSVAKKVNFSTNGVDILTQDYGNTASPRYAQWTASMPDSYNGGTFTAAVNWFSNATTGNIRWFVACRSYGDSETIDQSWGSSGSLLDTQTGTANQMLQTSASSAITCAGTPAGGELVQFRVYRMPADGQDTLTVTGSLVSVKLEYVTSSYSDN